MECSVVSDHTSVYVVLCFVGKDTPLMSSLHFL